MSENKRALLIGNNDYRSKTKLQFCVNNAEDLGKKLNDIDFQVTLGLNQTYKEMNELIDEFSKQIRSNDIVILFFAGYACQLNKQNVLIPIDTDDSCIDVETTLRKIKAQRPLAILFLFDYCCDNSMIFSNIKSVRDSCLVYDCTADKSMDNRNSLLTSKLLKYIGESNLTIDEIIYDVCDELTEETDNSPFRIGSYRKEIYLNTNIPLNSSAMKMKWSQNGAVVAGGLKDQLSHPQGVFVDDDHQCLYIADTKNHRIVQWNFGADCGQTIAGGNGDGNQLNQLSCPRDVIFDVENDCLIICDYGNRRIVRWARVNGREGEIIISDIDCSGLTMNKTGDLYVSDYAKGEVRCWKKGENNGGGVIVAGGNGKGREYDKLRFPTYIFVDNDESIYISDSWYHRVMKWTKNATEGILIAGKRGICNIEKELRTPQGLVVDHSGNVYVADSGNHRIMCWPLSSRQGYAIITGHNQFSGLRGLAIDRDNNLYVVDCYNNRILKFDAY